MKQLIECINESIQRIDEVSDETLKSAIEKCYAQGGALMRRRAKKFEEYLKNPERIKREELNNKSGIERDLANIIDKYLIPAYKKYDNKKRDDALDLIYDFVKQYRELIINNCQTSNIKIFVNNSCSFGQYETYKNRNYVSSGGISFTKKRHGALFGTDTSHGIAMDIKIKFNDGTEEQFIQHDLRKIVTCRIVMNFYKEELRNKKDNWNEYGLFSVYFDFPYKFVPVEYHEDFRQILSKISQLTGKNYVDDSYSLSDKKLNKELTAFEILKNSFSADMEKHSVKEAIELLYNTLKVNDPNCKIEFGRQSEKTHGTNVYIGTARLSGTEVKSQAILTYKDKEYNVEGWSDSGGWSTSAAITINGIKAFNACRERYDDGCWVGGFYKPTSQLSEIFGND